MARQPLTRRLLVGAAVAALLAGALVVALVLRGPSQEVAQPSVVPHLVPDVGGLHSGTHGTTSAPNVAGHPDIKLIPSAGGPVSAYGGAPSGATFLPAQKKG